MSKIKIFIGGVINISNAQNINCLSLVKSLDKSRFELYTLQSSRGEIIKDTNAKYFVIREPIKLFKYVAFLWGIIKADVCYFPKTECFTWNSYFCKLLNKKYFRTIESVIDEKIVNQLNKNKKSYIIDDYRRSDNLYAITEYMKDYNYKHHDIQCKAETLYLGVDDDIPKERINQSSDIVNVIIVGHDLIRKGVEEFIELSENHQEVTFHIVGSGNNRINMYKKSNEQNKSKNIIYHGPLGREELNKVLKIVDLLVLPSHSEGFPKVILECAAKGIPSLIYSSYGAKEWIENDINGFVCDNRSDFFEKFSLIKNNPTLIKEVKGNLQSLFNKFKWSVCVSKWEKVIRDVNEL
jgi:glycosyltransferase involved in cell wall biosynthesis